MIINCENDSYQCNNAQQFEDIIRDLLSKDSAEIWISQNGERDEYPCIALLVNENSATLTYFGDDGSCYSTCNGTIEDGFVSFCGGQYEIHSNQVISKEDALTVILYFYLDKSRSYAIRWDQLY